MYQHGRRAFSWTVSSAAKLCFTEIPDYPVGKDARYLLFKHKSAF